MGTTVQTRLDDESEAILKGLLESRGLNTSEVLRRGIRLVAKETELPPAARIVGIGEFDFGPTDWAANRKSLQSLGRSSIRDGKPRRKKAAR